MQFHLPRIAATALISKQSRVFMHWNGIRGCLVLGFSAHDSFSQLIFCTAHSLPSHSPGRYKYDTNHMRILDTELSRPYLSCFCRVIGVMTRHSGLLGTIVKAISTINEVHMYTLTSQLTILSKLNDRG